MFLLAETATSEGRLSLLWEGSTSLHDECWDTLDHPLFDALQEEHREDLEPAWTEIPNQCSNLSKSKSHGPGYERLLISPAKWESWLLSLFTFITLRLVSKAYCFGRKMLSPRSGACTFSCPEGKANPESGTTYMSTKPFPEKETVASVDIPA